MNKHALNINTSKKIKNLLVALLLGYYFSYYVQIIPTNCSISEPYHGINWNLHKILQQCVPGYTTTVLSSHIYRVSTSPSG